MNSSKVPKAVVLADDQKDFRDSARSNEIDSAAFIGFCGLFTGTEEAFVSLQSHYGFGYVNVSRSFDSTIYEDDQAFYSRKRLSKSFVEERIDLLPIKGVLFYNGRSFLIGNSSLSHVEWVRDGEENKLVAVFKFEMGNTDIPWAISAIAKPFIRENLRFEWLTDAALEDQLKEVLQVDSSESTFISHRKLSTSDLAYSVVLTGEKSYIVETFDGRSIVLFEYPERYELGALIVLPVYSNGKPLILIASDADVEVSNSGLLLRFDGVRYLIVHDNHIELRLLDRY